jgi:DNA-binding MarR family transcriptional regulator
MTSILDTLEKRELVHRGPHQEDRRKVLVTVTDEGRAILDAILPSLHQRERRVISEALTPQEQNRLLELLAKVQLAARDAADLPPDRTARRRKPQGS